MEIESGEFEEERERLEELVVYGLKSLLLISFGVIFLTLVVVLLLWEEHRFAVLSAFAVIYLGLGAFVFAMMATQAARTPTFVRRDQRRDEERPAISYTTYMNMPL